MPSLAYRSGNMNIKGVNAALHRGEPAGRVRTGARAFLLKLAHLPILTVGKIPEFDGIAGIKSWPGHILGIKEPFAGDVRAIRRERDDPVRHEIVRVEANQQVRPHDKVVDLVVILLGHAREQVAPVRGHVAIHGQRVVVAHDRHPTRAPRAARRNPLPEVIGGDAVELGMNARAMITLGIVFDNRLPVCLDLIINLSCPAQAAQVEAIEPCRHIAERFGQEGRIA
ncbi:MAG: hypothetical protein KatS3mg059_1644 [Thermomicrobiales bacterium]|nr:MAG: hypothetical protein KatS3mg059_1644 [Thermomicrobiales bacterium]